MDSFRFSARHRRFVLDALLISIGLNALLGIWALLSNDFGQTQGKVLATSFLVSGAMLGVLVNGAPLQRRVLWPAPLVAAVGVTAGCLLLAILMWSETDSEVGVKLAASALIVSLAATLSGLLALLALRSEHAVLQPINHGLIAALVVTILVAIWVEFDADWMPRLIGVESILVAALTLALPALAKFRPPDVDASLEPIVHFCPVCGATYENTSPSEDQDLTCGRCGAHAEIHLHPPPDVREGVVGS